MVDIIMCAISLIGAITAIALAALSFTLYLENKND